MGFAQTRRWCKTCGRHRLFTRQTTSAGWGCFLSLITAGIFLPFWLLLIVVDFFKPWRCTECGQGKMT